MLIGFQEDSKVINETGINRGTTVLIPKGTLINSCHPSKKSYISKKDMKVKVHHLMPGQNIPVNDRDYNDQIKNYSQLTGAVCLLGKNNGEILPRGINATLPISNPSVCWAGSSGYWCEADINSVIVCK